MTQDPRDAAIEDPQVASEETEPVAQDIEDPADAEASELTEDQKLQLSENEDAELECASRDQNYDEEEPETEEVTGHTDDEPEPADEATDEEMLEMEETREQTGAEVEPVDEVTDQEMLTTEDTSEQTDDKPEPSGEMTDEEVEPVDEVSDEEESQAEETAGQTQPEEEPVEENPPTIESVVEAILFASDEPLTDGRLAKIVETTGKQVRQSIETLNKKYEANHNAFRIEQIAGGYQMLTLNTYDVWLRKMLRVRGDTKLSPAAMETLAIIAYKQPVIRVDIEAIRGVAAGEVIRSLMYKGMVKIAGRAEILGRPMLYGTTKKFLEVFGLNSLKDLPKAEELKKPD